MGSIQTGALLIALAALNGLALLAPMTGPEHQGAAIGPTAVVGVTNSDKMQRGHGGLDLAAHISIDTSEITRRPPFNPARLPAIEKPSEEKAAATPDSTRRTQSVPAGFTLVGIVVRSDGQHVALVRTTENAVARTHAAKSQIDAWTIAEMNPDGIVLVHGKTRCEIHVGKPQPSEGPCAPRLSEHSQVRLRK